MEESEDVPQGGVGILDRAIRFDPSWQSEPPVRTVHVVAGRIALRGRVRCHPQVIPDEATSTARTALGIGVWRHWAGRLELVSGWIATRVLCVGIIYL